MMFCETTCPATGEVSEIPIRDAPDDVPVFAFAVLILVLIFRPSGLLGERVADRA